MMPSNTLQSLRWTLLVGILVAGLLIAPSAVTAQQATITTDGPSTASPGETITVSVTLTNTKSSQENYIADVALPEGWSVASHTDDGGTWNSGDVSWLWQNVPANSSVTPALTVNVPAEASGTATIETTAKSKDGTEDTTTHTVELPSSKDDSADDDSAADDENDESDDSDNGNDDSAGDTNGDSNSGASSDTSSGSSDMTDTESTQDSQASEESTTDEESKATTDTEARGSPSQTVHTIEDSNPEQPGTTVETSESSAVDRVNFDTDSVTGELTIEEYDEENIPQEIGAEISADIAQDLSSAEASESGESNEESQSEADAESDSTETDTAQTDSQATSEVSVITVADISPPEATRNTSASVTFTVNRSKLTTPEQAVITHKRDNTWHELQTEVVSTTDESVTLEANTESFSLFAVVEEPTTNGGTEQAAADGSVSDTLSTFHLTGLMFALVSIVLLKRYRL